MKEIDEKTRERINAVVDEFDAEKISWVMRSVGWVWANSNLNPYFPRPDDIRKTARKLLESCLRWDNKIVQSGGITACVEDDGRLSLEFVLEHKTYYVDASEPSGGYVV